MHILSYFFRGFIFRSATVVLVCVSVGFGLQRGWAQDEADLDAAAEELISQTTSTMEELGRVEPEEEEKVEIVDERPKEAPAAKVAGPNVFLKDIRLSGNTIFTDEALEDLTGLYENREIPASELKTLTQLITDRYRAQGYVTSRAYLPPQALENNSAEVRVLEGKIGQVFVEGNKHYDASIYQEAIVFDEEEVFRYQNLERDLYFLNQTPGIQAKAYLIPGEQPGTTDIILKALEKRPDHYYYDWSNRGGKSTHHSRHTFHFDHNSLTGRGDVLNSAYLLAEEGGLGGGYFQYSLPINHRRARLELAGSYFQSLIVNHFKPLEIEGTSSSLTPGVAFTLIRDPLKTFEWNAAFEIKNSKVDRDDSKISYDRMRVLKTGPKFSQRDPTGFTLLDANAHWGIPDFLGGSSENDLNTTRVNTGGKFTYFTGSALRMQRLPSNHLLLLRGSGQMTNDSLTSLEQFRAGGAYSVRGYPESDASGDYGYNFSSELRLSLPDSVPNFKVPGVAKGIREILKIILFYDMGKTYGRERVSNTEEKDRLLLGAGFGFRLSLDDYQSFEIMWGFPFGDPSSDKDKPQVHFMLKYGY